MKMIRVSTELELTVHEYPQGTYEAQHEQICKLIGNDCRIYEHVMPNRLYSELNMNNRPTRVPGQCVSMLIDEEGRLKKHPVLNYLGSYLYESDKHNNPIVGNILFVGEEWTSEGIDFCGIDESVFEILEKKLTGLINDMKTALEV